MATTVEVATVPSSDTPGTCIYIHHDRRSYVFGRVAEGTQRAFGSRNIRFGATENIFLSGTVGWEQMGGLVGYLLSVGNIIESAKDYRVLENSKRGQDGQKQLKQKDHEGVVVHGGDNLCHILAACRPVIFRQPISVRPCEHRADPRGADASADASAVDNGPDWKDDAVAVWKIPVKRSRSSSPPKRRANATENGVADTEPATKPRAQVSDPEVARLIVENIMFSGTLNNISVLLRKKTSELKSNDVAFILERGELKTYRGHSDADADADAAGTGNTMINENDTVYIFPREGDSVENYEEDDILAINHYPLPRTSYTETSMSYIVKCHDRRGKFNAAAAKELGVKPPDFKLLTAGESVQGKDGNIVTPEMVLGEPQPGKGIVIADIPSLDFLNAFLDRPEWSNKEIMSHVAVMYWSLGSGLAGSAKIQSFMKQRPEIKHVLCGEDTCPNMITHPSTAEIQTKLRCIDPDRFPLPRFDNSVAFPAPAGDSSVELGRAGKKLQLMPRLTFDDQAMAAFPDLLGAAKSVDSEILEMAHKAKAEATDVAFLARVEESEKDIPNRDAEIIPLGTGSSMPSKHRNVSATLIRVPGIGNYLLDCGEGTLGQIRRLFGHDEAQDVLRQMKCIVISHAHADHHMGTPSLIKAWYEQTLQDGSNATLAISCIGRYRSLLEEVSQIEDMGFHRLRFPSCPWPGERDRDLTTREDLGETENFGLASIKRIPVPHCWRSYGTQLELTSGLRIAYSGDCRPSKAFAQACEGAHLLVHECTFGDDKQDHAKAKKHSTMGEALGVARDMAARRTLLTHFSQRYAKSKSLRAARDADASVVLLAFDFMRVRLGDFQAAACYVPAVEKLMEKMAD